MEELTYNEYMIEWENAMKEASEAFKNCDDETFQNALLKAQNAYEKYKEDVAIAECKNFGACMYVFEDALPTLFKNNKNAVKDFMTTIKEDKNLLSQFKFYKALDKFDGKLDAKDYISECIAMAKNNIDTKLFEKSNKKLCDVINSYRIVPTTRITEDKQKFYSLCDYLLCNDKKLKNLYEHDMKLNDLISFVNTNTSRINEDRERFTSSLNEIQEKYPNILTEDEKSFVQEIIDCKATTSLNNKVGLFEKFKNECIVTINKLLEKASNEERIGLEEIKEQITNKKFSQDTLVEDIAKLLEIRDVLLSE